MPEPKIFGLSESEKPTILDNNRDIIQRVKELRGKAACIVGMCQNWSDVDIESPMVPIVALVSAATNPEAHVQSRLFLDNQCHSSMAGTGGICTAACSRLPGSIVNGLLKATDLGEKILNIQHPLGILPISVGTTSQRGMTGEIPEFEILSFIRTSRRICDGRLYVPDDVKADVFGSEPLRNAPPSGGHVNGSNFVNGIKVDENRAAAVNRASKNSSTGEPLETTSITKQLAKMVAETLPQALNDQLIMKLKGLLLDYIGVGAAGSKVAESSFPFYKAM